MKQLVPGQSGKSFVRKELIKHLVSCQGKTLGTLDWSGVFNRARGMKKITGIAGNVIEQSVLCLNPNPNKAPDIEVDGVQYEVKTTGVQISKKNKSELEAKEPVTITAVSPEKIIFEEYSNSTFWHKIAHLLFFYYFYNSDKTVSACEYAKFPLLSYHFHEDFEFSDEELRTLEQDWTTVRDFIILLQKKYPNFEAEYPRISHELREKLMLIDTAPKWPNRPRFRFKRTFVTSIFRQHWLKKTLEHLPCSYTNISEIDNKISQIVLNFKGKSVGNLCRRFSVKAKKDAKSIAEPIIVKMFGGNNAKMRNIDLFSKIGLLGKSIVLTRTGARTEDTKFFTIDFSEFYEDEKDFESSQFYEFFSNTKILFVVFKEPSPEAPFVQNRFEGLKIVSFDNNFIETKVRPVWNLIRKLIRENKLVDVIEYGKDGLPIVNKTGVIKSAPNFPKSRDGDVFIRGTSTDSRNKPLSVNGVSMYHQQVWVKGSYFASLLKDVVL